MSEKSTTSTKKQVAMWQDAESLTKIKNWREVKAPINTQYNHKIVANNVPNEIKQKRVVTSEKWTTTTKKQVAMWHNA